jgi:hypothetical protein
VAAGAGGQYRINLVWTSHGGQVLATMGQIQSGMRQVGGVSQRSGRDLGYFNRQMMAVGTTMRYMFAGGAIFGTMSAFRQFAEFQSALGGIAAISENLSRSDISNLGNKMLGISTDIATPVGELQQSARNIQSTMQLTREEANRFLPEFVEMFGTGAKVAETDAYNFGNAIMGMRNAFDLSLTDMDNIAGQFFTTIQRSAGMTGDEWAKFSGRVVAGAGIAGASLEEMNALMVLMTRQGGTAATNVRHLAQFLQRLRDPTQETIPKWSEIGLPPQALQSLPYSEIIKRLKEAVQKAGGITRGKKLSEETLAQLEESDQLTPAALGIKGGGAQLLTELFGRMESRRAALVVLSEMLSPPKEGLQTYEQLLGTFNDTEQQAKKLDTAMAAWLDRNRIQQAGTALRNMLTEALVPAEDVIRGISMKITEIADPRFAQAAAAGVATYGAYRLGRFGVAGVTGLARYARGLGTAGIAVTQAGAPPSGSFANPFWVIIHPLSNVPGLGGKGVAPVPGTAGGGGAGVGAMGLARGLGMAAIPLGIGVAGADYLNKTAHVRVFHPKSSPRGVPTARGFKPGGEWVWQDTGLPAPAPGRQGGGGGFFGSLADAVRPVISGQLQRDDSNVNIRVDASDEAKRLLNIRVDQSTARKRTHVPVGHSAWKGGAIPQLRGGFRVNRNQ